MATFSRIQHKICKELVRSYGLTGFQLIRAARTPQDIGEAWAIAHLNELQKKGFITKKIGSINWSCTEKGREAASWKGHYDDLEVNTRHEDLLGKKYIPARAWTSEENRKLLVLVGLKSTAEDIAIGFRRSPDSIRTRASTLKNHGETRPLAIANLGLNVENENHLSDDFHDIEPTEMELIIADSIANSDGIALSDQTPPEEEITPLVILFKGHTYHLIK